jgi:DNA-binding NtrC family response regulator
MGDTLLIIEADPVFRENLAKRLTSEERRILFADRIAEAKKTVRRNNTDVVLLGLTLLEREGLAILKMIKKVRPLTEVITINGAEQIALSIESMKLGAFDDFVGPFNIDALAGRVQDAVRQKRQRETERKPPLHRFMDIMAAGAFAEAGEPGMALTYLENAKKQCLKNRKKGA